MKVSEQVELKALERRIAEASASVDCLVVERDAINSKIQREKALLEKLKAELAALKNDAGVIVSEHAILRYLERVYGMDIEAWKREILPESLIPTIEKLGRSGDFPASEKHRVRLSRGVVVTILTKDEK